VIILNKPYFSLTNEIIFIIFCILIQKLNYIKILSIFFAIIIKKYFELVKREFKLKNIFFKYYLGVKMISVSL